MCTKHEIITPDGAKLVVRSYSHKNAHKIPLILNDGIGCAGFAWKYFIDHFKKDHPIIHWNYRGHGESTMGENGASVDMYRIAVDLSQVVSTLKIKNMILCGHSMGVQVALEAQYHLKNKIAGLVLLCGGPGNPGEYWHGSFQRYGKSTLGNLAMKNTILGIAANLQQYSQVLKPIWSYTLPSRLIFELTRLFEVDGTRTNWRDFSPYFADLGRMNPQVFGLFLDAVARHSAKDILPDIAIPTLLVAADRDTFTPAWVVEDMHIAIPKSEFFVVKEGTHIAPIEHPELLNLRVEKFFNTHY